MFDRPNSKCCSRAALDSSDESSSSFIEMDPNMPPSGRFMKLKKDFDFNIPTSEELVHADELFSNGLLLPLVDSPRTELCSDLSNQNIHYSSSDHQKIHCSSLRRCRSLMSRKMFHKYLYFLCPLLEKIRLCRSKSRSRASNKRICPLRINKVQNSDQTSPRTSECSTVDLRRSCDSESSIHEAVLHCKRSFGK